MLDDENQDQSNQKISFESLDILIGKWKDGTFSEIIDDWKWIFSYSKRYKGAIAFYTILGIFSTSMGLVGSVASKYMIDIITGYQMSKLWIMIVITLGSALSIRSVEMRSAGCQRSLLLFMILSQHLWLFGIMIRSCHF